MRVLISGASVAGPVLAFWLARSGFRVTVVERAPALRKAGGHAVDLFRPAMDIVERMGLLARVEGRKTGTERLTMLREGVARPVEVEIGRLMRALSDRHAEIMRDDLAEIFYEATRDRVEYVFGDSITAMVQDAGGVDVSFEHAAPRRFELVIGADGLHSNVRRLIFGEERQFTTHLGAYLAVLTLPNYLGLTDQVITYSGVGRLAGIYSGQHMDDARALFMFRSPRLEVHHRDVARQKQLLKEAFAGARWEVPRIFEELERTPAFYFDSITQLRLDTWSRGRIALVGDAGYCPGPAVGGSTSLAIVGAYVLAGELAAAGGDHVRAFAAYERALGDYVRRSRTFAVSMAKRLIPDSTFQLWAMVYGTSLFSRVPAPIARAVARLGSEGVKLHDSFAPPVYEWGRVAATSGHVHQGM